MTTTTLIHPLSSRTAGDSLSFAGIRLARGPIRTTVRCRSERYMICDLRVGGVDRHLVVDLSRGTRFAVPDGYGGPQASTTWCQRLLEDLEAGRVSATGATVHPLDVVEEEEAA
ncbi:hypothetical protein [Brachybacterium kimchii]|uniref:Uncharacterized protein n=1 Tax=Brachybacterium kimchii TaxID=2942909 RepID=A0ABY4NAR8_9MICO|nr:hypothetical protein [Brachybacterium kimchii]UQN30518.1 hypothetical protein M4486_04195 [Brachybacterium kimchii]